METATTTASLHHCSNSAGFCFQQVKTGHLQDPSDRRAARCHPVTLHIFINRIELKTSSKRQKVARTFSHAAAHSWTPCSRACAILPIKLNALAAGVLQCNARRTPVTYRCCCLNREKGRGQTTPILLTYHSLLSTLLS